MNPGNQQSAKLLLVCLTLALAIHASPQARATPGLPGESKYTLELTPFARHTGENAIDLTHPRDGTGRVFVSTQSGQVFGYSKDGKPLGVFLDLTKADVGFTYDSPLRVPFKGLMYIAFHPDYADPAAPGFGKFYTGHQVVVTDEAPDYNTKDFGGLGDSDVRFMLGEWQVDPENPDRIDPASYRRVMLLHFHSYGQMPHALGELAFNPFAQPGDADYGKLYAAVGDGHNGDYKQPHNLARSQQADNPFAKILRIDPLGNDEKPYTIPDDNPFIVEGQPTEPYAIGLRDAQAFSFARDLEGQAVLVAFDIGALSVEEINIVRRGGNYGWDRYEGLEMFNIERLIVERPSPPAVHYGRVFSRRLGEEPKGGGMVAIIGGLVVSDPDDPSFQGQVLFGDLPNGTMMHANYHHMLAVEAEGKQSTPYIMNVKLGDKVGNFADVIGAGRGDSRFGVDESGAAYIVSKQTDTIFKTSLVFTGEPVERSPSVKKTNAGNAWAIAVVATVIMFLVLQLGLVYRGAKKKRA